MSEDDIASLVVAVTQFVEDETGDPDFLNDDDRYCKFNELFYSHLEKFCTKERNYN
jgi:hypothetical protein